MNDQSSGNLLSASVGLKIRKATGPYCTVHTMEKCSLKDDNKDLTKLIKTEKCWKGV